MRRRGGLLIDPSFPGWFAPGHVPHAYLAVVLAACLRGDLFAVRVSAAPEEVFAAPFFIREAAADFFTDGFFAAVLAGALATDLAPPRVVAADFRAAGFAVFFAAARTAGFFAAVFLGDGFAVPAGVAFARVVPAAGFRPAAFPPRSATGAAAGLAAGFSIGVFPAGAALFACASARLAMDFLAGPALIFATLRAALDATDCASARGFLSGAALVMGALALLACDLRLAGVRVATHPVAAPPVDFAAGMISSFRRGVSGQRPPRAGARRQTPA